MKADYNIMRPSVNDLDKIDKELIATQDRYVENGYSLPVNTLQLIRDMYKDEYSREVVGYQNNGHDDVPWIVQDRLYMLQGLTCIKLLNSAMKTLKDDPNGEFCLNFVGGKPAAKTADFFNLTNSAGEYVNIDRTGDLKLANGFYHGDKAPDIMTFKITSEGEHITMYQNGLKEEVLPDELGQVDHSATTDTPEQ